MKIVVIALMAMFLFTPSAFAQNLQGTWYHGTAQTFISNTQPNAIVIRTEDGRLISFHLVNQNTLVADNERLAGTITDAGRTIQWSNGTVWTRQPAAAIDITGVWFHHASQTSIRRIPSGYLLRNENGQETRLELRGNQLFQPGGPLSGVIDPSGQFIQWNNNTVWRRTPGHR